MGGPEELPLGGGSPGSRRRGGGGSEEWKTDERRGRLDGTFSLFVCFFLVCFLVSDFSIFIVIMKMRCTLA